MAKISKLDIERRYTRIKKLVKKYHTKDMMLPDVKKRVADEMGLHVNTISRALKSNI